ncbi:peptidyl-prolyl cis-trans isomerase, EpsD family [Sphingomonas laterariae]|uniref:peptidylprolyl isomerase n=1 Tax=Edaphosphingomonas laterariae TaxID=861865 RepID=A0A239HRA6_9SPHN|nr:SurA N-terminal domain-containing protein [Sphingomonas laterariae]SNS83826.1 peptidyl-prolyl cis-trans isomerase, EpsD family [Sphingomonas laterariae]
MKTRTMILTSAAAAIMLTLGACQKKAEGQVVAVVNGEEVSLQELNAELAGQNVPESVDKKALMKEVLQRVIDRKLLVQRAKEQGLDKDPEYLTQQRRLDENLLVSLLGKKAAAGVKIPDGAAIDKFISDNPQMFAQRTRYSLDQLQFDLPPNPKRLAVLEKDKSLAAVAASLDSLGIKYARGTSVLDSATTPPALMQQIAKLPAGEPFILPAGGKVYASVITGQQITPTPAEVARPAATDAIRRRDLTDISTKTLKQVRDTAKIDYQPGYEPAAKSTASATSNAAPATPAAPAPTATN